MKDAFDVLLLIARPAAGKSEVIDYLKRTPVDERKQKFHIGTFAEIDDFPMLWAWFEEDAILERMGRPRLHTDDEGFFKWPYLWDLLIERMCLDYRKLIRDSKEPLTAIVEFSRGTEHGGYARAFSHISREMAEKMAILYINVSWEESLRKNRKRFNVERPDSILEHGLPDYKIEKMYREVDWEQVSSASPEFIEVQGIQVPYVVFENEDDVTTDRGAALGQRLEETMGKLWQLYQDSRG
jgi:hypothetical protein